MKILFLHGLEGSPNGLKVQFLRSAGLHVVAPSLPKDDFEASVSIAQGLVKDADVIIGSSRGGAVAMRLNASVPMILLAPAWKLFGVEPLVKNAFIFHGEMDDLVSIQDTFELAEKSGLTGNIIVNQDDHRQFNQMPIIVELLKTFYITS